ncbi:sugar transferase [Marinobacterium nitratireducens]|uniref:sugar transferase n=1 Tax=Marinobacterium nitratireducens TaxID=518897 RepID=UPI00166E19C4|nr:sugar transferase [Marinobacterium nitratireducens]
MVKRAFDIIVAASILVLLFPAYVLLVIPVRIFIGKQVIFRQLRPGRNCQPFFLYKFRTMNNSTGPDGSLLPDEQRLTSFGKFLRSTSLDELPELWNVLKGDMSLVGPRPLLMEYLPLYNEEQRRRHEVKPGITGWAQINGRNALSWEEKFKLDVWYVDNQSFWLDMKILWMTVKKVLAREGINAEGQATCEKFRGNSQ